MQRLVLLLFIVLSCPQQVKAAAEAASVDAVVTGAPTVRDRRDLISIELLSLESNWAGVGFGYEHAFKDHFSGKVRLDFAGYEHLVELGVDFDALLYPFGRAPNGLFIGGHMRPYVRNFDEFYSSSLRSGAVLGYNLLLFRRMTVGYRVHFDFEDLLTPTDSKLGFPLIWEPDTYKEGRFYNWFSVGYIF